MNLSFRRIFNPTPEEQEADRIKYQKMADEYDEKLKSKPRPKLVLGHNGILVSEPFEPFYGDCLYCKHYDSPNVGFVEGGWCGLRWNVGCGWGCTCNDFEWDRK